MQDGFEEGICRYFCCHLISEFVFSEQWHGENKKLHCIAFVTLVVFKFYLHNLYNVKEILHTPLGVLLVLSMQFVNSVFVCA